jgi:hypothetical protein
MLDGVVLNGAVLNGSVLNGAVLNVLHCPCCATRVAGRRGLLVLVRHCEWVDFDTPVVDAVCCG